LISVALIPLVMVFEAVFLVFVMKEVRVCTFPLGFANGGAKRGPVLSVHLTPSGVSE
jgi:hypothetical protein